MRAALDSYMNDKLVALKFHNCLRKKMEDPQKNPWMRTNNKLNTQDAESVNGT